MPVLSEKSLQVAHSEKAVADLEKEYNYRKAYGFRVEWLSTEEISVRYNMASHPGILSEEGIDRRISCSARTDQSQSCRRNAGVRPYCGERISIRTGSREDHHRRGFSIRSKRIVFCTGFETLRMFRKKYADVISTFACVSEQSFNLYPQLKDLLIWDTADPYIYIRTTDDGRLLVGGEDIPYKYNPVSEKMKGKKRDKLIKKIQKLFPTLTFLEDYTWAGAFGVTKDGLPFIGNTPISQMPSLSWDSWQRHHLLCAGMELVLKILAGEDHPLLHYYRFDR